jgi:hypothetical protein
MAAPTLGDGISRAIEEFAVPSIGLIAFIAVIRVAYGAQEAGIVYLVATLSVLLVMRSKAKYWNVPYTFAVGTVGLLVWFGVPTVFPHLVPPAFATVGSAGGGLVLLSIAAMTIEKI